MFCALAAFLCVRMVMHALFFISTLNEYIMVVLKRRNASMVSLSSFAQSYLERYQHVASIVEDSFSSLKVYFDVNWKYYRVFVMLVVVLTQSFIRKDGDNKVIEHNIGRSGLHVEKSMLSPIAMI